MPFRRELELDARIRAPALGTGLICYPMGAAVDGVAGDHVLLAPPFIVDADWIGEIVDKLGIAVDATLAEVGG